MKDEAVAFFIFVLYTLNENNGVCYHKSPFDTGIQVLSEIADTVGNVVGVEEAIATQIYGAFYPNYHLVYTNFIPCHHG